MTTDLDPYDLPTLPPIDGDWYLRGLCRTMDPAMFFPGRGEPTEPAKAVCAQCPVRAECLDYAMSTAQKYGIWGGTSERERRARRSAIYRAIHDMPVEHGTRTMFARHRSAPDVWGPPCDACREAERTYNSAKRRNYRYQTRAERNRRRGV